MYFLEALASTCISVALYVFFRFIFAKFITKEKFDLFSWGTIINTVSFFCVLLALNYVFQTGKNDVAETPKSGQSFTASESIVSNKPLELNVNFEQKKSSNIQPQITTIETELARYQFSSRGACLQSMELFWQNGRNISVFDTKNPAFLLGMMGAAPYDYDLVDVSDHATLPARVIKYKAYVHDGSIIKTFVVHNTTFQVDVSVDFQSNHNDAQQQFRLFVPTPLMQDDLKAVVNKAGSGVTSLSDVALTKAKTFTDFWHAPKIFGFTTKFLAAICFAGSDNALERAYFKKTEGCDECQYILESQVVGAGDRAEWSLYVGPKVYESLAAVSPDLHSLMQYGWLTFLAKPILKLMVYLQQETGSYGWAIILVALLIKLLLLPFTIKGERSMKQQAEFEKKRAYLQQKYAHDKAAFDQATAELINKYGFPMLSGCLPMLLNIPVFFALNKVLGNAIQLHGASFLWLPDLSIADPYYILSIFVFVGMLFTSTSSSADPRQWASRFGFAMLLAGVTSYLASGLALFIMMNTALGVAQSYFIRKLSR